MEKDYFEDSDPRKHAHTIILAPRHREEFGNHKMPLENQALVKGANTYYKRKAPKHHYIDDEPLTKFKDAVDENEKDASLTETEEKSSTGAEDIIVDRKEQNETCPGDVIRLLEVSGEKWIYSLYKTWKVDSEISDQQEVFFILEADDSFPIIITKKMAEEIWENPEKGIRLVYNTWLGRYR